MDNQWKAENEFSWSDITGKTNITALYPVYPDLDYIQENLYKNNSLEDILYVKDEFPAGNSNPFTVQTFIFSSDTCIWTEIYRPIFRK